MTELHLGSADVSFPAALLLCVLETLTFAFLPPFPEEGFHKLGAATLHMHIVVFTEQFKQKVMDRALPFCIIHTYLSNLMQHKLIYSYRHRPASNTLDPPTHRSAA